MSTSPTLEKNKKPQYKTPKKWGYMKVNGMGMGVLWGVGSTWNCERIRKILK
jgi:hypothetical protein